jgi:hypothetical protein
VASSSSGIGFCRLHGEGFLIIALLNKALCILDLIELHLESRSQTALSSHVV